MSAATIIYDLASAALSCVCEAMADIADEDASYPGCPSSCFTYVSAGEPVVDCCASDCDDPGGMLTTHVESVFPSDNFPNPSAGFAPCKAATWVAVLVVTVARCVDTLDEQGNPQGTPDDWSDSARLLAIDQYAALTALSCCLVADPVPGKTTRRVQIIESRPVTTSGGCAAVEVRAFVDAGRVCACGSSGS